MAKDVQDKRLHRRRGLEVGDQLKASSPAPGIVVLELETDALDTLRGDLTGVYQPGDLDALRDEWH